MKIALGSGDALPTRVGAVTLEDGENSLYSAVIDTTNNFAYFGTYDDPGVIVKVALGAGASPPTSVGAVTLNSGEDDPINAVIDVDKGFAYFAAAGQVVKVGLGAGNMPPARIESISGSVGAFDPANGYIYYGAGKGISKIRVSDQGGRIKASRVGIPEDATTTPFHGG